MALINISFDTVNKTCKVQKDGKEITDVDYVSIYKYGEQHEISIEQVMKDNGDGTRTRISTYAEKKEGQPEKSVAENLGKALGLT